jgi:hypothetical protein
MFVHQPLPASCLDSAGAQAVLYMFRKLSWQTWEPAQVMPSATVAILQKLVVCCCYLFLPKLTGLAWLCTPSLH